MGGAAALLGLACSQAPAQEAAEAKADACLVRVAPEVDRDDPQVKELMSAMLEAARELEARQVQITCGTVQRVPRP